MSTKYKRSFHHSLKQQSIQSATMRILALVLASLPLATANPLVELSPSMPDGPQGPPGAKLVDDLISKLQPRSYPKGTFNGELEEYVPHACQHDGREIILTAKQEGGGKITSCRMDTNGVWTTSQSEATKKRGYVEVRATMPVKVNGKGNFDGMIISVK